MLSEIRVALRRLRRSPGFSLFAIATLGLRIGAAMALYAVAYATLFRPMDIQDIDRVVNLYHARPPQSPIYLAFSCTTSAAGRTLFDGTTA